VTDRRDNSDDATQTGEHRVLAAGTVLSDRYEIQELVGMGGMGIVYRARDRRLDVEVAIKLLNADRADDPETLERFERELVLARQVSHPSVVRIHDIGQDGDQHFLTMDFVPGRSLKAVLEEDGPMSAEETAAVGRDLAAALGAAHDKGVVHRDLKPANVLIDEEGRARITDFGVARSLSGRGLTRTGHVLGTPDYLSPEQALGENVDGRSDIYALGLLLYEMVSGELPFSTGSVDESLAQRLAGRPRDLTKTGADAPAWLERVIGRCLARGKEDRYQNARDLQADLERHAATRSRRRKSWRLAAAGAVVLVAALAWLFYSFPVGRDSPPEVAGAPGADGRPASSVAVVPFADETGRPELAWVSTGVAEMIAVDLAQAPSLEVVDSLRVFRTVRDLGLGTGVLYDSDARQLAGLLEAELLIMGRVRSAGDGLRLEARLTGVERPGAMERFDRDVPGPGELLDAAGGLTAEMRERLEVQPAEDAEPALSSSPEALSAYGEGVERLARGDTLAAVEPLERAVEEDPAFAAAWVRLADARGSLGYPNEASEAAERAVRELDNPDGRVALEARALRASLEGDTARALELRHRLVERFPNDIEARVRLGELQGDSGRLEAARETLSAVVEQDASHPRAWYLLGKFSILAGQSRRAIDDYLVRALVVQNRLSNAQGRADVLNAMGIAYSEVADLKQAQEHYAKAAELRREIGDRRGVAATLSNLAQIQALRGDYDGARQRLTQALEAYQELGNSSGVAHIYNEFGLLAEEQGDFDGALKHYRDALRVRRELGDARAVAESLLNVGYTYFVLGEYDNAAVYTRQAQDSYQADNNREGVMLARETLAQLETARGNWDAALDAALSALEASRELESLGTQAVSLGTIGRVAHFQGRFGAALESIEEALDLARELDDLRAIPEYELARAGVLLDLGAVGPAGESLDRAEAALDKGGNREQRSSLLRHRGEAALLSGAADEAVGMLETAVREAEASGSNTALLKARLALGRARLASGDAGEGRDMLKAVVAEAEELGHVPVQLQALEALADGETAQGDDSAALAAVDRALDVVSSHEPWMSHWRLRFLRASLNGETTDDLKKAAEELDRVRNNVPDAHRAAFDNRTDVGELDERRAAAES
jgi:tetratricopeptide (TPR) repeat protein